MKNNAKKLIREQLVLGGSGNNKVVVNYATIKRAALTLRALNHSLRKKLLETIEAKGEVKVTEIYTKLKLEQSVASQHLAIMRRASIVTTRRDGKCIYYTVNKARIAEVMALAEQLAVGSA
ncbi:MAG: helix-turn-helix transcriptional regulator [Chitinophagales bacterium]|nr:helix-turn-helix transcriptional regulator [Chitinophagales bacterium]